MTKKSTSSKRKSTSSSAGAKAKAGSKPGFGFFGWFTRPVAVPIEAVGIEGRQIASLDMARDEYAAAPTWQPGGATPLPADATIRIALARN